MWTCEMICCDADWRLIKVLSDGFARDGKWHHVLLGGQDGDDGIDAHKSVAI